jgi:hypothetical protein
MLYLAAASSVPIVASVLATPSKESFDTDCLGEFMLDLFKNDCSNGDSCQDQQPPISNVS